VIVIVIVIVNNNNNQQPQPQPTINSLVFFFESCYRFLESMVENNYDVIILFYIISYVLYYWLLDINIIQYLVALNLNLKER
jgi:hypothetical protein